ncbi:MAG: TonB family protein [Proteobacteria bacterium]|nr:TonB family protein [Pseudomonadota bacterium]MCZ6785083.1 TonB family protein [Pseudomonadota bacterium]
MSESHAQESLERREREQRDFRRRLAASAVAHGLVVLALAFNPAPPARPLALTAITVDLVAAVPATPAPARKAAPALRPPPPKKKIVLPKTPKPLPKKPAKVKPVPKPKARPKPRPPELDYEDALDKLRDELGEETPQPQAVSEADDTIEAMGESTGSAASGAVMDAWSLSVSRHVRAGYITPPDFRGRYLATRVCVLVGAGGNILGTATVGGSSGDPFFDDNAVRATERANPLPPPPGGGREVCFTFLGDDS